MDARAREYEYVNNVIEAAEDRVKAAAEENVAELVKNVRSGMGISQKAFAGLLGVSGAAVSLYEKGKNEPKEEILEKIRELQASNETDLSEKAGSEPAEEKENEPDVKTVSDEEPVPEKTIKVKKKATGKNTVPVVYIQSQPGGLITPEEVLKKVPEGVEEIYVKPEENKAYWVGKDDSGSIDLW